MVVDNSINELNGALELIKKPTPKRLGQAVDILLRIIYSQRKGYCQPSAFAFTRFEPIRDKPLVSLKKLICAICPRCDGFTFHLNTEIMQGVCLSCSFKSSDYKSDMASRKMIKEQNVQVSDTTMLNKESKARKQK